MNINNRRVFMLANYTPADPSIGITKKICSEINTLRKVGFEVYYSAYDGDGISIFDNKDIAVLHKPFPFRNNRLNKFVRYYWLEIIVYVFLKKENNFTLGYIRLGPPNSILFKIFDLLKKRGTHIIVESLAYFPGVHYQSIQGKYIQWMHKMNHRRFREYVEFFLVEGNLDEMYGVPCYPMNMGVEVDRITPHCYCGDRSELNLISVANENIYHAYDRIIRSLHAYISNTEKRNVNIHLVGTISVETKKLINVLDLNHHVFLYGKKSGEELERIYNLCNIGLGPLGQHRIGGKKDTGLKTKEYFAKGLPYIFSGEEPTVPKLYPYIKQFPSDESLIDFDEVWNFYQSFCDDGSVVSKMRKFAKENYSWNMIMQDVLSHVNWKLK